MSYDILILDHRLTWAGAFTSNSFQKDQYRIGTEYSYNDYFMARMGYVYEEGIGNIETTSTAFNRSYWVLLLNYLWVMKSTFGVDYSYTATDPFKGSHAFITCRIDL